MNTWLDDRLRLALLKESRAYRNFWDESDIQKVLDARKEIEKYLREKQRGNPFRVLAMGGKHRTYMSLDRFLEIERTPLPSISLTPHQQDQQLSNALSIFCSFVASLDSFGIQIRLPNEDKCLLPLNEEILSALNPYKEQLATPLPVCFVDRSQAVVQVVNSTHFNTPIEGEYFDLSKTLKPSERLLKIDCSRRKSAILKEVEHFLDTLEEKRKNDNYRWHQNYKQWKVEVARKRKETWNHLNVWRLRRQRKTFKEISHETGMSISTTKKAFARVFELIEGHKYDPERFKEFYHQIKAPEVKRTCQDCPDRQNCDSPCPDVLAFIEQDQVTHRERLTNKEVIDFQSNF
ncbi:MAG: hypothetical protein U9O82_01030 [Thermodesulfobacteriota bacterium]|nr:hypothetical protein [Thermodesulfobacteriota bacterium]